MPPHDPTTFAGSAPHYLRGRPPYSPELVAVLDRELGLDGTGRLLDVGSGPAVLAVLLAPRFDRVVALDPDHGMLVEAGPHAAGAGVRLGRVQALAEALPVREPFRAVTFGMSFHRTAGEEVAEAVHDLLVPGGAIVLIAPDAHSRPAPPGPGDPPLPHAEVDELVRRYLGPRRRMGQGYAPDQPTDRFEAVLARTRFAPTVTTVVAPGPEDVTRDVDGAISGYLSMSYAAPHLFGDRLDAFVADLRTLLEARTTTGRFWDWPGDTDVVLARKDG